MGIAYFIQDYLDQTETWLLYYSVLHAIGIFYFWKVHPKLFKAGPIGARAVILSAIGMGFGQAYNRQIVKAVFFAALIPIIKLSGLTLEKDTYNSIVAVIFLLYLADAGIFASSGRRRVARLRRNKEVIKKAALIKKYRQKDHQFAVDTNILMHEPDLLVHLMEKENFRLNMSMVVFGELDGLKKNSNPLVRKQAQLAFDIIEEYQRRGQLRILKTPKTDDIRKYGLGGSPDEKIIGTYLRELHNGMPNLIFLSNDKGARIIARNVGMPVAEL
ncbi:nucleotide-binding protein PInc [Bacillus freudenreichii]|nr:nucleotide-binding protein PInc [Bacillus freudenreichii]